jgi:hypothetical protein
MIDLGEFCGSCTHINFYDTPYNSSLRIQKLIWKVDRCYTLTRLTAREKSLHVFSALCRKRLTDSALGTTDVAFCCILLRKQVRNPAPPCPACDLLHHATPHNILTSALQTAECSVNTYFLIQVSSGSNCIVMHNASIIYILGKSVPRVTYENKRAARWNNVDSTYNIHRLSDWLSVLITKPLSLSKLATKYFKPDKQI